MASTAPLSTIWPAIEPDAARAGLGPEGDVLDDGRRGSANPASSPVPAGGAELGEALAGELDDRAALGRLVLDRGDEGGGDGLRLGDAGRRRDRRGQPVAVGDRAGLVEQDDVDVTRRLDGPAAHGQHVEAGHPVHAGDADGGQEAADRRRDEADQEGDEGHRVDGRAGEEPERPQGHGRHQEDDRQAGQQDRERDLVGRALALRALDEGDHPVEEGLAGIGGDADDQPVAGRASSRR